MIFKIAATLFALTFLLSACATTENQEMNQQPQPPTNHQAGQDVNEQANRVINQGVQNDTDLYNANKNVQQPQTSGWGWLNNQ